MTAGDDWRGVMEARIVDEVDYILDAFRKRGIRVGVVTEDRGVGYLYAEDQLLVRERYLKGVLRSLRRQGVQPIPGEPQKEPPPDEPSQSEQPPDEQPQEETPPDEAEANRPAARSRAEARRQTTFPTRRAGSRLSSPLVRPSLLRQERGARGGSR